MYLLPVSSSIVDLCHLQLCFELYSKTRLITINTRKPFSKYNIFLLFKTSIGFLHGYNCNSNVTLTELELCELPYFLQLRTEIRMMDNNGNFNYIISNWHRNSAVTTKCRFVISSVQLNHTIFFISKIALWRAEVV